MRLRPSLVAVATSLLLAGCGGAARSSSSSSTATATSSPTASAAAAPSSSTTTTSTTSAPPEVPKTHTQSHRDHAPATSQGAHVVVRVTVAANGTLSPPSVAVPSGVGVELHLTNRGQSARTVVLAVAGRPDARLKPGGNGGLQAAGQRAGTYSILVDGTPRGQLMSGAQGGP